MSHEMFEHHNQLGKADIGASFGDVGQACRQIAKLKEAVKAKDRRACVVNLTRDICSAAEPCSLNCRMPEDPAKLAELWNAVAVTRLCRLAALVEDRDALEARAIAAECARDAFLAVLEERRDTEAIKAVMAKIRSASENMKGDDE